MFGTTKAGKREYWKHYRNTSKPYIVKVCSVCGDEFKPTSGPQKRCQKCRTLICSFCGVPFIPENSTLSHRFCSNRCKARSQKGIEPKHLKLHRGIKPRTYHLRERDKHGNAFDREWRNAVFERDSYICQECGQVGGRLEAHHKKPYKAFPELRYEISNGVTLCKKCHTETDSYGWANYHKNISVKRLAQEVLPL